MIGLGIGAGAYILAKFAVSSISSLNPIWLNITCDYGVQRHTVVHISVTVEVKTTFLCSINNHMSKEKIGRIAEKTVV